MRNIVMLDSATSPPIAFISEKGLSAVVIDLGTTAV